MVKAGVSDDRVQEHYAHQDLEQEILSALAAAGIDLNNLKPENLAAIDKFHIRGRDAPSGDISG
jgi:hypothetical protein